MYRRPDWQHGSSRGGGDRRRDRSSSRERYHHRARGHEEQRGPSSSFLNPQNARRYSGGYGEDYASLVEGGGAGGREHAERSLHPRKDHGGAARERERGGWEQEGGFRRGVGRSSEDHADAGRGREAVGRAASRPGYLQGSSGRPSLLQSLNRASPQRQVVPPPPQESSFRGDGSRADRTGSERPPAASGGPVDQRQQLQLLEPLLAQPLDAGGGTRPAPWTFTDAASVASRLSLVTPTAAGATMAATAASAAAATSAAPVVAVAAAARSAGASLGPPSTGSLEAARGGKPGASVFTFHHVDTARESSSGAGGGGGAPGDGPSPLGSLGRSWSLKSPAVGSGEGVAAGGQDAAPRFQRSFSETQTGGFSAGAPGTTRARLGWGQGLARRGAGAPEPSPRGGLTTPTAPGAPPPPAAAAPSSSSPSKPAEPSLRQPPSPARSREGEAAGSSSKPPVPAAAGAAGAGGARGAGKRRRRILLNRLRRMMRIFARHSWHQSARQLAQRMAEKREQRASGGAAGASDALAVGAARRKDKERSSAGNGLKVRKERSGPGPEEEAEEEGARVLKRAKSHETDRGEARRQAGDGPSRKSTGNGARAAAAEAEAQSKLEKYKSLSASLGFPLCGLLPKGSVGRAVQAVAHVRVRATHKHGLAGAGTGAAAAAGGKENEKESEPEMVRLPAREDIAAVLEDLNAELERLQDEVADVEEQVASAMADGTGDGGMAPAPYQAPWWSPTYAAVMRLRREATEKLLQQQQQQHFQEDEACEAGMQQGRPGPLVPPVVPQLGQDGGGTAPSSDAPAPVPMELADAPAQPAQAQGPARDWKLAAVKKAVQEKKRVVRQYAERLVDEHLDKKEAWRRAHPGANEDDEGLAFLAESVRTRAYGNRAASLGAGGAGGSAAGGPGGGAGGADYRSSSRGGGYAASEYDIALITRELEEKEKMRQRIEQGSAEVPSMLLQVERDGAFEYLDTSNQPLTTDGRTMRCAGWELGERCPPQCNCPRAVETSSRFANPWSDMEKCIFLDKFLQYPKNFRKIATFLRRKSTHDVVEFYYDSKQFINYKALLKESEARRKSQGQGQEPVVDANWLKHAARQVGATIDARLDSQQREILRIYPPGNDYAYQTFHRHPGTQKPFHYQQSQQHQQQMLLQQQQQMQQMQQALLSQQPPQPPQGRRYSEPQQRKQQQQHSLPPPAQPQPPPQPQNHLDPSAAAMIASHHTAGAALPSTLAGAHLHQHHQHQHPAYEAIGMASMLDHSYHRQQQQQQHHHHHQHHQQHHHHHHAPMGHPLQYPGGIPSHSHAPVELPPATDAARSAAGGGEALRLKATKAALPPPAPSSTASSAAMYGAPYLPPEIPSYAAHLPLGGAAYGSLPQLSAYGFPDVSSLAAMKDPAMASAAAAAASAAARFGAAPRGEREALEVARSPRMPGPGQGLGGAGGVGEPKVIAKWTDEEKQQVVRLIEQHGRAWGKISELMQGSKKPEQIKNFYSNYKKKLRLDEILPPKNGAGASAAAAAAAARRAKAVPPAPISIPPPPPFPPLPIQEPDRAEGVSPAAPAAVASTDGMTTLPELAPPSSPLAAAQTEAAGPPPPPPLSLPQLEPQGESVPPPPPPPLPMLAAAAAQAQAQAQAPDGQEQQRQEQEQQEQERAEAMP